MFLTETASLADVVLPAANAYEKSGTFTNTCGDLQLVKKAGEVSGCKIRLRNDRAHRRRHGRRCPQAGSVRAGHATRTWGNRAARNRAKPTGTRSGCEAHGLEPKMSPFDPMAILDEIQRLVPGYEVSRMNLLAGNDQHTTLVGQRAGARASRIRN